MDDKKNLDALTRALVKGATLGTLPLLTVGCDYLPDSMVPDSMRMTPARTEATQVQGLAEEEQRLCSRALETQDPNDAAAMIRAYPESRCIAPMLTSLPAGTLRGIPPQALSALPPGFANQLPRNVVANLRFPASESSRDDSSGSY